MKLRICSCLGCVYRVMDARGKFGEREKCVRVAPWATLAFWVLPKLPKSIHNSIYAQLKAWANSFITERQQGLDFLRPCLSGKFPINNCVLYSPGWTNLKTTIRTEILPLNVVNDQLVTFLFAANVFRPKFAATGLQQICETRNLRDFSALFLLLVG